MISPAFRGGVAFLTRLPVRTREGDWGAFRETPAAFPAVGYLVGTILAAAVAGLAVADVPPAAAGVAFPVAVVLLTGVTHLDGVADLADAAAAHGDPDAQVEALRDVHAGAGAVVGLALAVVGTALAGVGLVGLPVAVGAAVVVAAEVGAKLTMAGVACLATARHEGLGSAFTGSATPLDLRPPILVALPAVPLGWALGGPPGALASGGALAAGVIAGALVARRAAAALDGVNGDVFGAANEVARVAGLHAGVVAWTLS